MVLRTHLLKIEGEESSSFVSGISKTSALLMICDARKWNLFLIEFMLICAKIGRLFLSSLNHFRLIFWHLSFSLSLSIWLLDRLDFLLQIASSSSSTIPAYLSFFQNFLMRSKKFLAKRRDPDSFKCKPFPLKCLLMIFLLSTMSIFNCSRWLGNRDEVFVKM